jgi:hypothetical protein
METRSSSKRQCEFDLLDDAKINKIPFDSTSEVVSFVSAATLAIRKNATSRVKRAGIFSVPVKCDTSS